VLFLGPDIYRGFKAHRATVLALKGEEMLRQNKIDEAIPTIRSAFLLAPDVPEVVRAMAQMLTVFGTPDAMTYWNWTIKSNFGTDDDRRAAAECAMRNNLYNQASAIIRDLLAHDGKDARNLLLAGRWSTQRGTPDQTMHFATLAVNSNPTYRPAVLFLAVQEFSNTYLHQDGVNSLFHLAESDDNDGFVAIHCLALDPDLTPAEIDRVIARLKAHPLSAEPERLSALTLSIRRHPEQTEALIDEAVAAHQKATPADLGAFAEWLNTNGEAARVLKMVSREKALSNIDICAAYIEALGTLNRWADLKNFLTGAFVPVPVPLIELYLSRCSTELGDPQGSDLHWHNAVSSAAYNPNQSLYLAMYAEKHGQKDRAAGVYRTLTQEPLTSHTAYLGLRRVLADSDTRTHRDLLDEMAWHWPKDREIESEDICLNLLLNEHVKEMKQRAISILADDSNSISHHTNLALACLRLNDPAGALKAYGGIAIDWKTAPVLDLVIYAAVLHANGRTRQARALLVFVDRKALRPEVRDLIKTIP
jgi:tetratricopeptide (TPR) repeat protein